MNNSALQLQDLLKRVCESPQEYLGRADLITALGSQGRLAKFQDSSAGIFGCSLNTLKQSADLSIVGGFVELDKLRHAAKDALILTESEDEPTHRPRTKSELNRQIRDLCEENQKLNEDLVLLTSILMSALNSTDKYVDATLSSHSKAQWQMEKREFMGFMSLRRSSKQ